MGRLENRLEMKRLLVAMLEETRLQEQFLANGDIDALVEATERWQEQAKAIDALRQAYGALPEEGDAAQLEAAERENAELVLKIDALHRVNVTNAQALTERFRTELKDMQKSNERMQTYLNPYASVGESASMYLNKKG